MIFRTSISLALVLFFALILAVPSFAPLKQVNPSAQTSKRLAQTGLYRIGLLILPDQADGEAKVDQRRLTEFLACTQQPAPEGWAHNEGIELERLAVAVMAAEAVSRPAWRQAGEVIIAQGFKILGRGVPNMTYGPLQIRASKAVEHLPELAPLPRAKVVSRLEDACFSLNIAARMLHGALAEMPNGSAEQRLLAAVADYSGYLGSPENYRYSSLTLRAYQLLEEPDEPRPN